MNIPFDSNTTDYSVNNAYWLARAAKIAYQDTNTIQPSTAEIGLDRFEFLSRNDTEGFVAASDRNIIITFRGTEPSHMQDVLADARIHKVPGPFGKVHRGFLRAFGLVRDDMYNAIKRFRNEDNPQSIWCTGHSLGAALAIVATADLLANGQTVNGVYNYGQPRVGNREFAAQFDRLFGARHFRFVNNNDTVTRVPPREFGYKHNGTLRYIDHDGKIRENLSHWRKFLDRVSGRMEDLLDPGTDGIKDHSMPLYVQHIESATRSES